MLKWAWYGLVDDKTTDLAIANSYINQSLSPVRETPAL